MSPRHSASRGCLASGTLVRGRLSRWGGLIGLACLSCTGSIETGGTGSEVPAPGDVSGTPKGNTKTPPAGTSAAMAPPERVASTVCTTTVEPGPAVIRRLTRLEYNNSVRDLLGYMGKPASDFPAETVIHSFDNEATTLSASPVLIEGYLNAAERVAQDAVDNRLNATLGCDPATGEDACATKFIDTFGKRAYRRPLTAEDRTILTDIYTNGKASSGFKGGIRMALTTMLGSAHFLYRVEFGATPKAGQTVTSLTPWEMASRLSYLIWRSMPDAELTAAADGNKLSTRAEIDAQVTRLLADPKAHDTVADFHEQWLSLRGLDSIVKDPMAFPTFKPEIPGLMKQETLKFVDNVVWEGEGTLNQLYTAPFTFVNTTLAKFYKMPAPTGTAFQKVALDGQARAGFLTQGGLMSVLAKENQTHPVRRGAFVRKDLLCQALTPPPDGVKIEFPPQDPTLTGRERFVQHRVQAVCATCHSFIDPIGFGLEAFDGIGMYRQMENNKTIDTSGEVIGLKVNGKFNGVTDLGALLAKSEEAADCAVLAWFRYGYGRDAAGPADACSLDVLKRSFASGKIKELMMALAKTDAFQFRRVIPAGGAQ